MRLIFQYVQAFNRTNVQAQAKTCLGRENTDLIEFPGTYLKSRPIHHVISVWKQAQWLDVDFTSNASLNVDEEVFLWRTKNRGAGTGLNDTTSESSMAELGRNSP